VLFTISYDVQNPKIQHSRMLFVYFWLPGTDMSCVDLAFGILCLHAIVGERGSIVVRHYATSRKVVG
jgi:hypothetical protein